MVQVLMESNHKTPKILMLYDVSLSMPKEYYKEQMDAFINTLQQKILTTFPAAIIDKWPTPSELFTWLLKASKTDYDLLFMPLMVTTTTVMKKKITPPIKMDLQHLSSMLITVKLPM